VLTWQNRITYILVRERDLFGRRASRRQVIRTSNAYVFRDPKPGLAHSFSSPVLATPVDPDSPLERAWHSFAASSKGDCS
jgi:hypothetical protein